MTNAAPPPQVPTLLNPPLPPSCCCLLAPSSSFSLVILILSNAGCLCSALEFIKYVAVDDWIFTASVFCLVKGFLKTDSTWILKFSMSPCSLGWQRARCFANALESFLLLTSTRCCSHLWKPETRKSTFAPIFSCYSLGFTSVQRRRHIVRSASSTTCEVKYTASSSTWFPSLQVWMDE